MKIASTASLASAPLLTRFYTGTVERKQLVDETETPQFRISLISFKKGATNRIHSHGFDQAVLITEGEGIVQVEGAPERPVSPGDVIFFPAGERHLHGPVPGREVSYLTITPYGLTEL